MGLQDKIYLSKITPRSLKAEDMWGTILSAIVFFRWYRRKFGDSKLNCLSSCCLTIWAFTNELIGKYPILGKWTFFFPILDGLASILRPKYTMNFLHSIIFTIKIDLEFSLFSATSSPVSKIDPGIIGPGHKRCDMITLLSLSILYHHILPNVETLEKFWKWTSNFVAPRIWWKYFCMRYPFNLAYSGV